MRSFTRASVVLAIAAIAACDTYESKYVALNSQKANSWQVTQQPSAAPSAARSAPQPAPSARAAAPLAGLKGGTPQRTAFALVVGIDHYRDLPAATGARADAEHVAELLTTTFGIPEANVKVALDDRATKSDVTRLLAWLAGSVPAGGRAYFFYSGHGSPDVKDGSALIVPYETSAQAIDDTAIPLAHVYEELAASKAKEVVAFVDACFSGAGGRSVLPAGTRPLLRVKDAPPAAQLAVFSAADGAETSGPAAGGEQGAFTKYLVQGLGTGQADVDGDGQITMAELAAWVGPRVTKEAHDQSRDQHPKLALGSGLGSASDLAIVWGIR